MYGHLILRANLLQFLWWHIAKPPTLLQQTRDRWSLWFDSLNSWALGLNCCSIHITLFRSFFIPSDVLRNLSTLILFLPEQIDEKDCSSSIREWWRTGSIINTKNKPRVRSRRLQKLWSTSSQPSRKQTRFISSY